MPKFNTHCDRDTSPEAICEPNKDYVTNCTDPTGYIGYTELSVIAERMGRGEPAVSFRVHDDTPNPSYDFDGNATEHDTYNVSVDVFQHDGFDIYCIKLTIY